MKISILGLTITSAWGNGHATTYRSLCQALHQRGHAIRFLEKDVSWYRDHRDLPAPSYCDVTLYREPQQARGWIDEAVTESDLILMGSYFPDGVAAADAILGKAACPVFFYDIDTPITVERLRRDGGTEAIRAADISRFDAYLSFTGGPILRELETHFGAQRAVPLYCSVDPEAHQPQAVVPDYEATLSYLGTYSEDRQQKLCELLLTPSRALAQERFIVAGAQYPHEITWPPNVHRFEHVPPSQHAAFYSSARYTLNLTRDSMVAAGWSPSVRLFEAAACGAAIISDSWPGLEELLTPGEEIYLASSSSDVLRILANTTDEERMAVGRRARARILAEHTSAHRAAELEAVLAATSHAVPR